MHVPSCCLANAFLPFSLPGRRRCVNSKIVHWAGIRKRKFVKSFAVLNDKENLKVAPNV